MLLDDCAAQAQAQAHAFFFGREKGGEQLLSHCFGNAFALVDDCKFNPLAMQASGSRPNAQGQHPLHSLQLLRLLRSQGAWFYR